MAVSRQWVTGWIWPRPCILLTLAHSCNGCEQTVGGRLLRLVRPLTFQEASSGFWTWVLWRPLSQTEPHIRQAFRMMGVIHKVFLR